MNPISSTRGQIGSISSAWLWAGYFSLTSVLIGILLWPLAGPGVLLHRDMVVLDQPALSLGAFGFGDLPARNAPQDGVLAVFGAIAPASLLVRLLLVLVAALGAYGAFSLARVLGSSAFGAAAAITLTLVNPFVVERLLQGQWSLTLVAWLAPGIVAWGMQGRCRLQLFGLWLSSLTPTGAILGIILAVLSAKNRVLAGVFGAFCCLSWLVPSLCVLLGNSLEGSTQAGSALADSATVFAVRAESGVGRLGALVTLGGMWNSQATPTSLQSGFAIAGIVLFGLLLSAFHRVPKQLLILLFAAILAPLVLSYASGPWAWAVSEIPGAAVFRDTQKLLILAIPGYVALAAQLRPRLAPALAILLCAIQLWSVPSDMAVLVPSSPDPRWEQLQQRAAGREVFAPHEATILPHRNDVVLNPLTKAVPLVEDGSLRVDGTLVDAPSPRFQLATKLWESDDLDGLRELGVGLVLANDQVIDLGGRPPRDGKLAVGLGLTIFWLLLGPGLLALGYLFKKRQKLGARVFP